VDNFRTAVTRALSPEALSVRAAEGMAPMKYGIIALVMAAAAPAALAQRTTLYTQNFEAGMGAEWSANSAVDSWYPTFTNFNGRYSNSYTQLTMNQPSGGHLPGVGVNGSFLQYWITFDLYIIDSWDGLETTYGTDRVLLSNNGSTIMNETFSNQPGTLQSFRSADVGPEMLGFDSRFRDSIYRQVTVPFTVPMDTQIRLRWFDGGLQGVADESWGIDNVKVEYQIVPAPGALALVGAGLLTIARRRRTR
jgi:hypothetical protein